MRMNQTGLDSSFIFIVPSWQLIVADRFCSSSDFTRSSDGMVTNFQRVAFEPDTTARPIAFQHLGELQAQLNAAAAQGRVLDLFPLQHPADFPVRCDGTRSARSSRPRRPSNPVSRVAFMSA